VGSRIYAFVAMLAAAALTAACTSTVSGHGAAIGAGPGTNPSGSVPAGFPSGASSGAGAAGTGVSFSYPQGHFRATFPARPATSSEPGTVAGASFTLYLARAQVNDAPTLLACEDISVHLPADQDDDTLRGAIGGFEGSSGLTLTDQSITTFRGHVARQAHFASPQGDDYTLLAALFSDQRLYLFFAPSGAMFDTLTSSFVPI
jgi:predicted small secreted protein